jgi:murein L,D-transpeptidase YcbB/YkuD
MKPLNYLQHLFLRVGMIILLLFSSEIFAEPNHNEFEELCSEVITSRLETEPTKAPLLGLYEKACFVPVWIKEGAVSSQAQELFQLIRKDRTLSHTTHLFKKAMTLERQSKSLYEKSNRFSEKIELELAISELYKKYAEYRLYGSIDWKYFYKRRGMWVGYKPKLTPETLLEKVINDGKSLKKAFLDAEPKEYHYQALKQALFSYLDLRKEGGWKPIAGSQTIRAGKDNNLIPIIRRRLRVTGDNTQCQDEGMKYDDCLKESVTKFQKRNGLAPDGVIGKQTIRALNRGLDERIDIIKLNLDRIKWFNQRGGNRHIIVNIPAFTLYFEENGKLRLEMKVITGKRRNRTPIFSNTVQQIVLNPAWNVPKNIVQEEIIPRLIKNHDALAKDGIDIYTGWGKNAQKIDPGSVEWTNYRNTKRVPFRFTQPPGPNNALGKVKFLFPNRFSVYMHDTPSKYLFSRNVRAFSHGCIRLEKPIELLEIFTSFNETLNFNLLQKRLWGGRRVYLKLDTEVPVDIVYLTAWVDYDGVLQFRNDIYGYDKIQLSKMKAW